MREQVYGLEDHGIEVKHYGIYATAIEEAAVTEETAQEPAEEAVEAASETVPEEELFDSMDVDEI